VCCVVGRLGARQSYLVFVSVHRRGFTSSACPYVINRRLVQHVPAAAADLFDMYWIAGLHCTAQHRMFSYPKEQEVELE
jgi:hypothetical protein